MIEARARFLVNHYKPQNAEAFIDYWERLEIVLGVRERTYEWWEGGEAWDDDAWYRWDAQVFVGVREENGRSRYYTMVPSVGDERWRDFYADNDWSLEYLLDCLELKADIDRDDPEPDKRSTA